MFKVSWKGGYSRKKRNKVIEFGDRIRPENGNKAFVNKKGKRS